MYRVVLVDDERLIIRGLSTVIPWAELGCEIAGTAHDGVSGLELIRSIRPDIVLTERLTGILNTPGRPLRWACADTCSSPATWMNCRKP